MVVACSFKQVIIRALLLAYFTGGSSSFISTEALPSRSYSLPMASSSMSANALSIGPNHLRTIVRDASRQVGCDVHGIVWLEHLNLVVGDMEIAKQFYVEFLGLSIDTNVKHFNLGQQQFHLAANSDPPQRITGSVCLTVPSLSNIRQRTQSARDALSGTLFSINEFDNPKMMSVTCPWGNTFHLYDISIDDDNEMIDQHPSPRKMVNLHREGGAYGPTRMAVRGQPGIRAIEIACRKGTANKIAQFYKEYLNCTAIKSERFEAISISLGQGIQLIFVENDSITDQDLESMNGVHVSHYIHIFVR